MQHPGFEDGLRACSRSLLGADVVPALAKKLNALAVVTDMSPLRIPKRWVEEVSGALGEAGDSRPLFQVLTYPCIRSVIVIVYPEECCAYVPLVDRVVGVDRSLVEVVLGGTDLYD